VRALRALGLSLEEIGTALADPAPDLATMLELLVAQLSNLTERSERVAANRQLVAPT
jgi:DNA-binding transcriptional MerR regulator